MLEWLERLTDIIEIIEAKLDRLLRDLYETLSKESYDAIVMVGEWSDEESIASLD